MPKLVELTIEGRVPTGQYINKYNLFSEATGGNDLACLPILETIGYDPGNPGTPKSGSILEQYTLIAQNNCDIRRLYCRDIYNVNDFAQVNLQGAGWQGKRTGVQTVAWETPKLVSTRKRQDIQAGYKALFPPVDGDVIDSFGQIGPGYLALAQTLCTRLGDGLQVFINIVSRGFGWAIVSKEAYTTPRGKRAYRYYDDPAEQFQHIANQVRWAPVEQVTTQNTRKPNRGR